MHLNEVPNVALVTKTLIHNGASLVERTDNLNLANFLDFCSLCEAAVVLDEVATLTSSDDLPPSALRSSLEQAGVLNKYSPAVSKAELRRLAHRLPDDIYNLVDLSNGEDLRDTTLVGPAGDLSQLDYSVGLDRLMSQIVDASNYPSLQRDGPDVAAHARRSNAYLLTAAAHGLDYFPDYDRAPLVAASIRAIYTSLPRQLYENVAAALSELQGGDVFEPNVSTKRLLVRDWTLETTLPIPPVAAIVLGRCKSRDQIPDKVLEVRNEFEMYRRHFRQFRSELQDAATVKERKRLLTRYKALLAETSGPRPELISISEALNFAEKAVQVGVAPTSPTSYSALLLTQPVEWLQRWWRRRPLAVLFRLDSKLPRFDEYSAILERLWGAPFSEAVSSGFLNHAETVGKLFENERTSA